MSRFVVCGCVWLFNRRLAMGIVALVPSVLTTLIWVLSFMGCGCFCC